MSREIAQAIRCQLLTGSYSGKPCGCPCDNPTECPLSAEQREQLKGHPLVKRAAALNLARFKEGSCHE